MEALLASIAVPTWAIVVGTFVLLLLLMLWLRPRTEGSDPLVSFMQLALLLAVGGLGFVGLKHFEDQARDNDRNSFALRASVLFAQTSQGGAASCIDGSTNVALNEACKKLLFSEPQWTTAALALTRQRLGFISEVVAYPDTRDLPLRDQIETLRAVTDADPFGFVAETMFEKDNCTPESCALFSLLRDPSHVKENLKEKKFEALLAKYLAGTADISKTDQNHKTSNEQIGSSNLVIPTVEHSLIQSLARQPVSNEAAPNEPVVAPVSTTPKPRPKSASTSATPPSTTSLNATPSAPTLPPSTSGSPR
jgi:hypothetical protein